MNSLYLENEEIQNNQLNKESIGPGLYMMDICKKMNGIVYPWAPTVRLQKMGGSINQDMSLIDTESDLFNIVNINSNDPNKKYIPDPNKKVQYQDIIRIYLDKMSEEDRLIFNMSFFKSINISQIARSIEREGYYVKTKVEKMLSALKNLMIENNLSLEDLTEKYNY